MNDLYLIGNGFDLAHGLKTSYNDFLLWYLKKSIMSITPDKLFEDDLISIKKRFGNPLEVHTCISELFEECKRLQIVITYKHDFFKKIVENYRDYKWVDIEYEYYMALVTLYRRLEKAGVLKHDQIDKELGMLNICFASIKDKLEEYLFSIKISDEKKNRQIEKRLLEYTGVDGVSTGKKLFLYFNYTSTIDLYRNWSFDDKIQLIHIHGKLRDNSNPIIFGYGDEMDPHYEKIENLNNNEFLKNIKSFSYFKTDNYQKVIRFIEGEGREFTVKILGHSCGLSDRILLNTIFEHPNCKQIKIFHYEKSPTENDYFEKTQEISRHFKASKKGEMRVKIVPFDKDSAMPQNPKEN